MAPDRNGPVPPDPLGALRRRLTLWYAGTFVVILAALALAVFVSLRRQLANDVDHVINDADEQLARAMQLSSGAPEATSSAARIVAELQSGAPERSLAIVTTDGRTLASAGRMLPEILDAARVAARRGQVDTLGPERGEEQLRIRAQRVPLRDGGAVVAVAATDVLELEDRYSGVIIVFIGAAVVATALVIVGGWLVANQAVSPVRQSMENMRRFVGDAAHQLRTPLTILRGRIDMARREPPNDWSAALDEIDADARNLSAIASDLLTLARADAGERAVSRIPLFLDDVVLDATHAVKVLADAKGVTLAIDGVEEAPVVGDAELLRQLVVILLDNAVKYTPPGGRVVVSTMRDSSRVHLSIADTGRGIDAADLPRVFDRFYRGGHAAGSSSTPGAGLGLSIARWIVDVHGGSIAISSPGAGSVVRVVFPAS